MAKRAARSAQQRIIALSAADTAIDQPAVIGIDNRFDDLVFEIDLFASIWG